MKIYYINFDEKPITIKKGYMKNVRALEVMNKNAGIIIEHNGHKIKIKNKDIYIDRKDAEERLNEYYIIQKFKNTHEHQCIYCGKFITNPREVTVDHIIPRSKGGKTEERNLCIACEECNKQKTDENPFDYINKEIKVQMNKEKGNRKKIGRSINLKADNAEYFAKKDSRIWNLNFFKAKNPYKIAKQLGC